MLYIVLLILVSLSAGGAAVVIIFGVSKVKSFCLCLYFAFKSSYYYTAY